jgi:CHAT domain-containing protein
VADNVGSSADNRDAQEVARLSRVKALVDAQATKKQLESLLEGTEVIHLAAHAIRASNRPFERAIVLATTSADDGRMRVRDIDAKTLRARLVVRSYCATAGGAVTGDGVLSLGHGLLAAGAHTVLASPWAVADESTACTMIDFHRRVVENPFHSTPAAGVRQAQWATRARYPSHAQWAPFVLWGWPP